MIRKFSSISVMPRDLDSDKRLRLNESGLGSGELNRAGTQLCVEIPTTGESRQMSRETHTGLKVNFIKGGFEGKIFTCCFS